VIGGRIDACGWYDGTMGHARSPPAFSLSIAVQNSKVLQTLYLGAARSPGYVVASCWDETAEANMSA
jgi:hypothetical protein